MDKKPAATKYPQMTPEERRRFEAAVAEETAAMAENIAAARKIVPGLLARYQPAVDVVRRLRQAREAAGVSLNELEQRTGIRKSVLSRLENSKAPNPTLGTLQRYAEAIGAKLTFAVDDAG